MNYQPGQHSGHIMRCAGLDHLQGIQFPPHSLRVQLCLLFLPVFYGLGHVAIFLHALGILCLRLDDGVVLHDSRNHIVNHYRPLLELELARKVSHDQDIVLLILGPGANALERLQQRR